MERCLWCPVVLTKEKCDSINFPRWEALWHKLLFAVARSEKGQYRDTNTQKRQKTNMKRALVQHSTLTQDAHTVEAVDSMKFVMHCCVLACSLWIWWLERIYVSSFATQAIMHRVPHCWKPIKQQQESKRTQIWPRVNDIWSCHRQRRETPVGIKLLN